MANLFVVQQHETETTAAPAKPALTPAIRAALADARRFVRREYRRSPSIAEIAAIARLSQYYFHRLFRTRYGTTPIALITRLKIGEAKRRLRRGERLQDVAAAVGFAHASHLCHRFRKATGCSPASWAQHGST